MVALTALMRKIIVIARACDQLSHITIEAM